MKAIILSGGIGTRLYPSTQVISKQLLTIYDKPMIYYPLSILILSGIREILIITTKLSIDLYKNLLKDGSQLGINITYAIQNDPKGLAEAFIIGEDFIGDSNIALILGDNIFYGHGMIPQLRKIVQTSQGATIFGYYVKDPQRYGVAEIDANYEVLSIEEKPAVPKSNYAITGLYFFDNSVIAKAKKVKPSPRGELEITSIIQMYLEEKTLKMELLGRGIAWLDTGTHESLLEAANFIATIENRQGLKIACIEEAAYNADFIDQVQLLKLASAMPASNYSNYVKNIIKWHQ